MVTFNVNRRQVAVDVSPDTPLLWVLHDSLGLTGTRFGCGLKMASCGACTVHLERADSLVHHARLRRGRPGGHHHRRPLAGWEPPGAARLDRRGGGDFDVNPLGEAIHPKHGRIAVPQGSGLGVDPDAQLLQKLRTS